MRQGIPLAVVYFGLVAGALSAQERIPLPPPDPAPAGSPPAVLLPPGAQVAPELMPPPQPYGSAASSAYPPPGPAVPPPSGPFGSGGPAPGVYLPSDPSPFDVPGPVDNPRYWAGLDGLVWWTKNQPRSIPLVTTGPAFQGANAGNLGAQGTTSLDGPLNYGVAGGARLFAGGWFNPEHSIGMDGSLFILGQQSAGYNVIDRSGAGSLVINEPVAGAPFTTLVSAPGLESGDVSVRATSRFGGGDLNLLCNLYRGNGWTFNLVGGYRYLQLDESLTVTANSNLFVTTTYTDNLGNVLVSAPPGSAVTVIDRFGTRNAFNGGQVGTQVQYLCQRWVFGGVGKLAVGGTHEVVTVDGSTLVLTANGNPVPLSGGNYATLQTGRYFTNRFALAPELQLYLGYQLTPCLRTLLGYDFLYLSSVARPGNQIDNTYDGVTHPLVPMTSSSFWAQGLTLSLQFHF